MDRQSELAIIKALSLVKDGKVGMAKKELDDAFLEDLLNRSFRVIISFCSFWIGAFEKTDKVLPFSRSDFLFQQWKLFEPWTKKEPYKDFETEELYEDTMYSFRTCVYSRTLKECEGLDFGNDDKLKSDFLRKMGLCNKRLGNYDTALNQLKESNAMHPGQAEVLAEMADCYELCGESKTAKILFREAFFVGPEKISLENLDSPLIHELVDKIRETKDYKDEQLLEWLPVYGILLGAFNIKRPLKSQEVGRLKQSIYSKENELKAAKDKTSLVPRLMNQYLWLMDHYLLSKEGTAKINELLLKIKLLDSEVYEEYFK